eukprot:g42015.t1
MNAIYKFVDTAIVGLISNNDKTNELIIDFGKKGGEHAPIYINGTEVKRVKSIKFLRAMITDDLSWTSHVNATVKKAQHRLFFLRTVRKLQKVLCTANITQANLPSMDSIYTVHCGRKAANIKDPLHP